MIRRILIVGLIVLAVVLPLGLPLATFILDVPLVVAGQAACVSPNAQPLALLALAPSRAPPSH